MCLGETVFNLVQADHFYCDMARNHGYYASDIKHNNVPRLTQKRTWQLVFGVKPRWIGGILLS